MNHESDMVLVPRRLTAENGAKYLLSGEFFEDYQAPATEDMLEECPEMDETYTETLTISWTNIKAIHVAVVEQLNPYFRLKEEWDKGFWKQKQSQS